MGRMTATVGVNDVLSLMKDERRRYTLYCLLSNKQKDIDILSAQIASWERDETIMSVSEKAEESVKISLHHIHLPRLAESNIVEYDSDSGDIVRGDAFDDVLSTLKRSRAHEEEGEVEDLDIISSDDGESESFPSP